MADERNFFGELLRETLGKSRGEVAGARSSRIAAAAWIARCVGNVESLGTIKDDLPRLGKVLKIRSVERGSLIFGEEQLNPGVWIVRDGSVHLQTGTSKETEIVGSIRSGGVDGDIATILSMPTAYSAWAVDDCKFYYIDPTEFLELLDSEADVARLWMTSVAKRLVSAQARIVTLLGSSVEVQVARLLLSEHSNNLVVVSQGAIAAMVGAQRSSVNRALKEFQRRGLLEVEYRSIRILLPEELQLIAGN
ncbi:MAG: Crp/Fnr family transcriptional regulator [Actinomycetota bacterium]|nr:Crp/Fnr family transcriptional regulator [Actinomycetota bacterium]